MPPVPMTWRDVCFIHWRVDPASVRDRIPSPLSVDTYDGDAWVGAVPFRMSVLRMGGSSVREFPELNFRTYVSHGDLRGTYFFSIDAASALFVALARRLFGLPYYRAEARMVDDGDRTRFAARRTDRRGPPARFQATWRPAPGTAAETPGADSREVFLVGRRRYFTRRNGRLHHGTVRRDPFRLRPAEVEVESNSLFAAADLPDPGTDPVGLVAEGSPGVRVGDVRPVNG